MLVSISNSEPLVSYFSTVNTFLNRELKSRPLHRQPHLQPQNQLINLITYFRSYKNKQQTWYYHVTNNYNVYQLYASSINKLVWFAWRMRIAPAARKPRTRAKLNRTSEHVYSTWRGHYGIYVHKYICIYVC